MRRLPSLRWHKAAHQFVVSLSRRDHYLGTDRAQAAAKYDALTAAWLARGRRGESVSERLPASGGPVTIAALVHGYLDYADGYYMKNGRPTPEPKSIRLALRPLVDLFGDLPAAEFGPRALKGPVIDWLKRRRLTRQGINARLGRIRRFFKWAVSEELVPASVLEGLRAVPGLKRWRTDAPEADPVGPVAERDLESTLPFMPEPVRADLGRNAGPGRVRGGLVRSADHLVGRRRASRQHGAHDVGAGGLLPLSPRALVGVTARSAHSPAAPER